MVSEERSSRVYYKKAQMGQSDGNPEEWDRYEQSVLQKLADEVKISIRGNEVKMTVSKSF